MSGGQNKLTKVAQHSPATDQGNSLPVTKQQEIPLKFNNISAAKDFFTLDSNRAALKYILAGADDPSGPVPLVPYNGEDAYDAAPASKDPAGNATTATKDAPAQTTNKEKKGSVAFVFNFGAGGGAALLSRELPGFSDVVGSKSQDGKRLTITLNAGGSYRKAVFFRPDGSARHENKFDFTVGAHTDPGQETLVGGRVNGEYNVAEFMCLKAGGEYYVGSLNPIGSEKWTTTHDHAITAGACFFPDQNDIVRIDLDGLVNGNKDNPMSVSAGVKAGVKIYIKDGWIVVLSDKFLRATTSQAIKNQKGNEFTQEWNNAVDANISKKFEDSAIKGLKLGIAWLRSSFGAKTSFDRTDLTKDEDTIKGYLEVDLPITESMSILLKAEAMGVTRRIPGVAGDRSFGGNAKVEFRILNF